MRKIVVVIFVAFSVVGLATAQIPTSGNLFFGYSYLNTDLSSIGRANTSGWEASVEGKVLPWVGIVADFSGNYGSQNFPAICPTPVGFPPSGPCLLKENINEYDVLFGPRLSASVGRFRPFAQAMLGVGHANANYVGTSAAFATALGVGLDYRLMRVVAWRFQGDYLHNRFFGTRQENARVSTGIVLRF